MFFDVPSISKIFFGGNVLLLLGALAFIDAHPILSKRDTFSVSQIPPIGAPPPPADCVNEYTGVKGIKVPW